MNSVMSIKSKHTLDAFLETGMFHSREIQERREERMRRDARMALRAAEAAAAEQRGYDRAKAEADQRERELEERHQQERAGLVADVMAAVTMAATFVGLAMIV